jgi:hypothetical protein
MPANTASYRQKSPFAPLAALEVVALVRQQTISREAATERLPVPSPKPKAVHLN